MCNDRGFIDYCQIVSYISNHIYGKIKPYGCLSLVNLLYTDEYIILILQSMFHVKHFGFLFPYYYSIVLIYIYNFSQMEILTPFVILGGVRLCFNPFIGSSVLLIGQLPNQF